MLYNVTAIIETASHTEFEFAQAVTEDEISTFRGDVNYFAPAGATVSFKVEAI